MSTDWRHTTTARLRLDQPTEADVDDLHAIHSDPDSWRHFPLGRHTSREQSAEMVTQSEWQFATNGLGYWSIRDRPDGPVVGRGGCTLPTGRMWWNLYYRFASSVHGRGYATEMGARAIEAARELQPDRPVMAYLLEHNVASRRTAERLGMQLAWRGPDRPNPDPTRSGWCTSTGSRPASSSPRSRTTRWGDGVSRRAQSALLNHRWLQSALLDHRWLQCALLDRRCALLNHRWLRRLRSNRLETPECREPL